MPGNYSPSELLELHVKAESYYPDGAQAQDSVINSVAAQAVIANQTARFRELQNPNKDRTVAVTWMQICSDTMDDCTSNCDLTGPQLDTQAKEYELNICKKKDFSVNRETLRTNEYDVDEVAAKGLANMLKAADQFLAQRVLAQIKANAGINVAPQPYTMNFTTMETDIPAADYNRKLVAYFQKVEAMNNMQGAYYIDNGSLYLDFKNAQFDSGNLDGKGDLERIRALKMYFDLFNFGKAGITTDTFMVSPSAVGLYTRARNPIAPREVGGKVGITEYSVASPTLPGVRYDMFYTVNCVTNGTTGRSEYVDVWRLQVEGLVAINPTACPVAANSTTYAPTGILAFNQLAA
jgi:hypothetical protein